jgi:hypothetical protein
VKMPLMQLGMYEGTAFASPDNSSRSGEKKKVVPAYSPHLYNKTKQNTFHPR